MTLSPSSIRRAALGQFTDDRLYLAPFLFSLRQVGNDIIPVESATGTMQVTAYRQRKDINREQPGTLDLRHKPHALPAQVYDGYEAYTMNADLYRVGTPIDGASEKLANVGVDLNGNAGRLVSRALMNDMERRMAEFLSVNGNFGTVVAPATATPAWSDKTKDPLLAFEVAWSGIETGFGTLEEGFGVRLALCEPDYYALINHPFITRYKGDSAGVVSATFLAEVLRDHLLGAYPEALRTNFEVRVHKATAKAGNIGQSQKTPTTAATKFVTNRSQLVIVGPPNPTDRTWGQNVLASEMAVTVTQRPVEYDTFVQAAIAQGFGVFDASGGVTFNGMVA